jgi:Ca-activated chloride channel homolog
MMLAKSFALRFALLLCCLGFQNLLKAGGFMVVMPSEHQRPPVLDRRIPNAVNPALFPLENRSLKIETSINDQVATTSIDQVFFNPTTRQLEAYFLFPIPKDVIINKFTMFINGKEMAAEMLDATKARQIYEEIVRRSQDPALLEYYNQGLFRVRIFPILPNQEQRIKLTYTETLVKDNGTVHYHFPLNTQKYSSKPLQNVSMRVQLQANSEIKTVYCPTYKTDVIRKSDKNVSIGFEHSNHTPDKDFELYYNTDVSKFGASILSYQNPKEDGYFMLNLSPGFGSEKDVIGKDVVFVFDKSGSMSDEKMAQGKKALKYCINKLSDKDRFEVVVFSTEAQSVFGKVQSPTKDNQQEAETYIDKLEAMGGTNIDEAFAMAIASRKTETQRPFFIVFMTDGKPTIGETDEASLLKKVEGFNKTSNLRIFTFGIGTDINTHLLDKITEATRAYRTYILPEEKIDDKIAAFYDKVSAPVLTDIRVEFDKQSQVSEVYHKNIPDLFRGETLTLMGRYKNAGKTKVTVHGKIDGKEVSFQYELQLDKESTKNDFVSNLWAARAVAYLLDQIRLKGENQELVQEVVRLAKKHGIITPYTSFLILEDEARTVQRRDQPNIRIQNQILSPRAAAAPVSFSSGASPEMAADKQVLRDRSESAKSGKKSVKASTELQAQNEVRSLEDFEQNSGKERLAYKDSKGEQKNLSDNILHVNGRALYNNNNKWVDANISLDATDKTKIKRVQFNSKEYFELLNQPNAAPFLALGQNVQFMLDEEIYEVFVN